MDDLKVTLMESDSYYTIKKSSKAEFKDRGSRFIAELFPVDSPATFDLRLEAIKNEHFKARHHCFAYRLRDTDVFRYSDDGEPSGTAGKPIFNQLAAHDLKDAGCVVTRYFGGTKLGTSGLIQAYREATRLAIEANDIIINVVRIPLILTFDYGLMGTLMDVIKQGEYIISQKDFGAKPRITLLVRLTRRESAVRDIKAALLGRSAQDVTPDTNIPGLAFLFPDEPVS